MSTEAEKKMSEDPAMAVPERKHAAGVCCNFCGKSQKTVRSMIAGPDVYICNECIDLCNDIILELRQERMKTAAENALTRALATMNQLIWDEREKAGLPEYVRGIQIHFHEDSLVARACLEGMGIKGKEGVGCSWEKITNREIEDAPSNEA